MGGHDNETSVDFSKKVYGYKKYMQDKEKGWYEDYLKNAQFRMTYKTYRNRRRKGKEK